MSESVNPYSYSSAVSQTTLDTVKLKHGNTEDKTSLDMDDFLNLMVVSLQNQSIDNTADTSDMLNQMVQMSVIQAISNISTIIEDSSTLTYAASLVGKDVTVGRWEGNELKEIEGTIMGTGTLNGEQVIFLEGDENAYKLSEIMGIGKLPEKIIAPGTEVEEGDQPENNEQTQTPPADNTQTPPVENPNPPDESASTADQPEGGSSAVNAPKPTADIM